MNSFRTMIEDIDYLKQCVLSGHQYTKKHCEVDRYFQA